MSKKTNLIDSGTMTVSLYCTNVIILPFWILATLHSVIVRERLSASIHFSCSQKTEFAQHCLSNHDPIVLLRQLHDNLNDVES